MPAGSRARRETTDEWAQLRLLVGSPEQATYELLRPIGLFGQPATTRVLETEVAARTLRHKVARFAAARMRSLFEPDAPPAVDRRTLPLGIRKAIVELKAEHSPLKPCAIARICQHRFDRPVSYHTVTKVLTAEPLPLHRAMGVAPRPPAAATHDPQPMPFAGRRRRQYWSVDIRYLDDHQLGAGQPVYVISILENFSRGCWRAPFPRART